MAGVGLTWRLQGGYTRFLTGSRVELRLRQGPLRQKLDVSPLAFADRSQPIDLRFEAARTLRGQGPGKIGWLIRPAGSIRARILFAGNAFLGNFRVPAEHLAIQWDVEASAEAGAARQRSRLLLDLNAGTRLYHSWVTLFSQETLVARALREAWKSFRHPLDSAEVSLMPEGQVVRWRWSGRVRLAMDVQWSLGPGWAIPGIAPVAQVQAELTPAFAGARWETVEEGEFSIQLRRKNQETRFRLRRHHQRTRGSDLAAGISLGSRSRVIRLSPKSPDALRVVTKTLSQPLLRRVNRVAREALSKRLEIALAVERTHWKGATTMVSARWSDSDGLAFQDSYSRLLSGDLPQPGKGLKISGRLENFRGREWAIRLNFLNWIEMGKSSRSETRQALVVDPTGGILLEQTQELEKTRYKWDEIQFLRLLHRETTREGRRSSEFLWSYGRQQRFSRHSLDQLLRMALRVGIIPEYSLPATSSFPLTAELFLVTRFSPSGLSRVRQASPERKWQALVRALELAEPERYKRRTFWRDWIDYPKIRERIDEDPAQTHLATRYPVGGRRESQRRQVVGAYRRSKRFLALLEGWSKGEAKVLQAFRLGLDIPVFVFFHLLCPAASRRSAALMTGEWEQRWGEPGLLEQQTNVD